MRKAGLFLNGRAAFVSGTPFTSLNPATNEVLAEVYPASPSEVDEAVQSARRAFPLWAAKTNTERGRVLKAAAALLRGRARSLAELETSDTGKPISESLAVDIPSAADCLEFFGGVVAGLSGRQIDRKSGVEGK